MMVAHCRVHPAKVRMVVNELVRRSVSHAVRIVGDELTVLLDRSV